MGFYRSSFLFVYNVPSFVTEHMVSSNIRRLEYVKFMPQFYDNMRCGFALVEIDESRMSQVETKQVTNDVLSRIREKNFSGQQIEVDEVWFKSVGGEMEPPHQDLLKSNFIFVYNMPSNGYTQQDLEELTRSNNIIFLPEIDDDTRCAFVEVPELSEYDWDQMLSSIRQQYRRGCKFSVDEIWLNPASEVQPVLAAASAAVGKAPESRPALVRDYQPPPPEILSAPTAPVPHSVTTYGSSLPEWSTWNKSYGTAEPVMQSATQYPQAQQQAAPWKYPYDATSQPPQTQHHPPWQPPSLQPPASGDRSASSPIEGQMLEDLQRVLTSRLHHTLLPSLLDEEVRALAELVSIHVQLIQRAVQANQPSCLSIFFGNVQAIHAEQSARRGGHLPLGGLDAAVMKRCITSAISKMELTSSMGSTIARQTLPPVPATPESPVSAPAAVPKKPAATPDPDAESGEPPAKRFASPTEETRYLFINSIPKSLPLMQLLQGVPMVENFVFCESTEEQSKSGFAFLKSHSNALISDIVQAFLKNGPNMGIFRVCLEPLNEVRSSPTNSQAATPNTSQITAPSTTPAPVPAPPPPPTSVLHFDIGNGKSGQAEAKSAIVHTHTSEEIRFMKDTGFNDERAPIAYCVSVRGMPINTSESNFSRLVKDKIPRIHEYCLLNDTNNKGRRALFFGGSHDEATALMGKLKSLLQTVHHKLDFRVLLTNDIDSLAPLPSELVSEIKTRRLILYNLPDWPVELLLMRVGKFIPKAMAYFAPRVDDMANTTLGHIYLGYESHEDADADLYRLADWKLTSGENVCVKLVVDTGWGKDGQLLGEGTAIYRQLERILRYRRETGADRVKVFSMEDALTKYKVGPPATSDLHATLSKFIYEGARETLYAMVIRRLPLRLNFDNFIRRVVKGKLGGLEASSMLSANGEHKEVIVFFGSRESSSVDAACTTFRQLVSSRNRDFMAVLEEYSVQPEVERHLGDTFVPVTKDFAMRRGCQFLIFSSIPADVEKTDCLYGLRSLCPNARSFYVPIAPLQSTFDTGRVLGYAVARFTDPRQCRAAFLALSPTCTLAGSTIRVSFAALHKVLSTSYLDRNFSVPLHVWLPWLRYNPETSASDPWVADNTSRSPFFCTCHHVVLPFKPTQFKGYSGGWRKNK